MAKVTGLTANKMLEIEGKSNSALSEAQSVLVTAVDARDTAVAGVESITGAVVQTQNYATQAEVSATNASESADRAEAASGGVDMTVINNRLDTMDTKIQNKANLVSGKVPFSELSTSETATQNTIPSRSTNGRLPGIGTPTAASDAATKGYADTITSVVNADLTDFQKQFATKQDLLFTTTIETFVDGQQVISSSAEKAIIAAPVDMEITAVVLTWDDPINISGTTNSCNVRIVHRPNTGVSGINIVQLSSEQQKIGGSGDANRRKAWNMKNGIWNTASNRIVPAGNVVSFVLGSPKGSFNFTLPMVITIMWRPV